MVKTFKIVSELICLSVIVLLVGCSKSSTPPTGKISGTVTDLSNSGVISGASVILFDASTNSPLSSTATDNSGNYAISVTVAGNYFLKFYKQGYLAVPPQGVQPVSFEVVLNQTTTQSAQMIPSGITSEGYISGKVSVGNTGKPGVLVVAKSGDIAYSAVSDNSGTYTIYNVPAASYYVKGYLANFATDSVAAAVTANTETPNINVTLTQGASGTVTGTFNLQAATGITAYPATIDISLIHPITKETIPGLSQNPNYGSSFNFSFAQVPDGNYAVRTSFANDQIVVDPDRITKFGDYTVKLVGGTQTPSPINVVATSAVSLKSPTNELSSTVPVEITDPRPIFSWNAYPSTSDYIIEVTDASTGQVIWGGFSYANGTPSKNITILSSTTSVQYNADSKAKATLISGKVYRWRIYASKTDTSTLGWHLISASEDQTGLFKIK